MGRVRAAMADQGVEVLLLSVGADLPWLIGYEAMPLERLTMLVVPLDGEATLLVPRLEAPRVVERAGVFSLRAWDETDDPVALVAQLCGSARTVAVGDRTWSRFLVGLLRCMPGADFRNAGTVLGPLRAVKSEAEVDALRVAGQAIDRVVAALQAGEVPLVGRSERAVAAELARRIVEEGHERVNFTIVASGPNSASPHHEPGDRVIGAGELVLFDIGGTMLDGEGVGYCSDITRCLYTGEPAAEVRELYAVLQEAHRHAVTAATVGTACEAVDAAARDVIVAAGLGEYFVHRTGHGIGVEAHEDPYIVAGNSTALVAGHAFSIEPGIYLPERFGARLEDIVVATERGPEPLNVVDHGLLMVEA